MTNRRTLALHVDIVDFRNRNNHMRHTAVDEVNGLVFMSFRYLHSSRKSVGSVIRSVTKSPPNSAEITPAGVSKEIFFLRSGDPVYESRETARAVAAHLGFSAIGVEVAHPKISAGLSCSREVKLRLHRSHGVDRTDARSGCDPNRSPPPCYRSG